MNWGTLGISLFVGLILGGLINSYWEDRFQDIVNESNDNLLEVCQDKVLFLYQESSNWKGLTQDWEDMYHNAVENCENGFDGWRDLYYDGDAYLDSCYGYVDDWKEAYYDEVDYCDGRVKVWEDEYYDLVVDCYGGGYDYSYPICSYNAYDCKDFSTWSEAQTVMEYCGGDIHHLDGDNDGIACEGLR